MEDPTLVNTLSKKLRLLTAALILSGALNIGLVASVGFSHSQNKPSSISATPFAQKSNQLETTMQQAFAQMAGRSFREIVPFLTNRDPVGEGYLQRDMALAALVSLHHFNLTKALCNEPIQQRLLRLDEEKTVAFFPAITEEQFAAIIRFAYEEKWPLTSEGCFKLLQKRPGDPTLVQAFLVTPEFHAVHMLFQKTDAPQDPALILQLIAEGNWDLLDRFIKEQEQVFDLSIEKRRRLLLSYLSLHSPMAAQLLLKTDLPFVSKKLEDRGAIDLIHLLKEKTVEGEELCLNLLRSPRSDAVWEAAAQCLYCFAGEPLPAPFELSAAIARWITPTIPAMPKQPKETAAPALRQHVVKEGENLWKIARQYRVKVDDLVQLNGLAKDRLYPGMTLRIPPS